LGQPVIYIFLVLFKSGGQNLTIIECEECNTKLISSNYGKKNACQRCACGNLQIIFKDCHQPSKIKGLVTVRYQKSYPKITEISELDKILADKEKQKDKKKFGFGE